MLTLKKMQNSAFTISRANPDAIIIAAGGDKIAFHSLLMSISSPLLKSVLTSLNDSAEACIVIPDFKSSEITHLLSIMYGVEEYGFVSGKLLDVLGMGSFKELLVIDSGGIDTDTFSDFDTEPKESVNLAQDDAFNMGGDVPMSENQSAPNGLSKFTCNLCDGIFKTKNIRNTHMKNKHSSDPEIAKKLKEITERKALNLPCPLRELTFNSRNLKNHIKEMHKDHQLVEQCPHCKKTFSNGSHLSRHMSEVHSDKPEFECSVCNFTTIFRDNLKEHMRIHTECETFKCDKCEMVTIRARELKNHKCKVKTFECEFCSKRSATKEGLRKHKLRVHQ